MPSEAEVTTPPSQSPRFSERVQRALGDLFLRKAVRFTADRLRDARAKAVVEKPDFDSLRSAGRRIRTETIENLDHHLSTFRRNLERAGGTYHVAADREEAARIVVALAQARGVKLAVKSKSMISEEIHLNAALEAAGIEPLETDLGEWIVQLAKETPSHLILPAIHKSRAQIRALFEAHAGHPLAEDTKTLAGYARRYLRQRFLVADLGLSGCNFGVAESGSVAIFTNEGNGRLVTTLPRIHVVMMGMERIVPTLADLGTMAELLPRSATGQKLTTYLNILTGPRREAEIDGPDELHVIVLDGGRRRLLGDPELREILHCIRCGACLNVCPVYRQIGGHAYGSVYPGPIGAVLAPSLVPDDPSLIPLPEASSLCGACTEACPVQIPLDSLLVRLRHDAVKAGRVPRLQRLGQRVGAWFLAGPRRFGVAGWIGRKLLRRGSKFGPLGAWSQARDLPPAPDRSFRDQWKGGEV